ncbi:MAG: restriction endonuclease subunit S [Calditrichaceae bacterium]|nr:restriction endonuclease subunit S [Calditrichaceae bacterium]MBN2710321.1 restriction endonuclease subunit S [Calditrichaceae bacterium]RQV92173.1 MAG: restriction endonuclease subunit S [Calditrichota bacterium]
MSNWEECSLKDVLGEKGYIRGPFGSSLKRGEMKESGIPVYEQKNAIYNSREFRFYINETKFKELERFQVNTNDLIISCSGTVGKISIINENDPKGIISQALLILRPDVNKITLKYLFYFLSSKQGFELLTQASHGSVQINIAERKVVESIPLILPPLPEQKAIAGVLSSLDDKIDLLHRQNKTLEAMAETLFRQWFVEEAPDDWEEGVIPDEFDFTMGLSPPGNSYNEDCIGIPLFQGNADFEFRFPKNRVYTTDPRRFAEKHDTLISVRAPVGAQNMAKERCCIGRGVATFRYKHNNKFYTYTYFKLKSLMNEIQQYNETGTVFGSISKSDFQSFEITIPPYTLVERFQSVVKPIDDKIITNCLQIHTLEQLRDTLLPKLMSGEVRVSIN